MKIGVYGQEKEIPAPLKINVLPMEIAKSSRTASGRTVKDIVTVKNNYTLEYKGLAPASMKIFADIYARGEAVSFVYEDSEGEKNITVYVTSLPRDIFKQRTDLSQNVSIKLEEV